MKIGTGTWVRSAEVTGYPESGLGGAVGSESLMGVGARENRKGGSRDNKDLIKVIWT